MLDPHILGGKQVDLPVDDLESLDVGPGRPALGVSAVEKIDPLTGEGGGSGKGEGDQAGKQGEFHGITVANGRVMQRQKRKPEITRSHFRRVESDRRSRLRCECSSSHSRRQPV